jgi:uncharacterized protein YutD
MIVIMRIKQKTIINSINDYRYKCIEELRMSFDREMLGCKYSSIEKLLIYIIIMLLMKFITYCNLIKILL